MTFKRVSDIADVRLTNGLISSFYLNDGSVLTEWLFTFF